MNLSDRVKSTLLFGLTLLALNLFFQMDWMTVLLGFSIFIVGKLILIFFIHFIDFSDRTEEILLNGSNVLAVNILSQGDWGSTFFVVIVLIVGALIYPSVVTFMTNEAQDNRYK